MNKLKLLKKLTCWVGYCLFAGYSSYMTAKSVAMSFELNDQIIAVFVFVFIVALLAGWCLSITIEELQNRFNPSKARFIGGILGFLLFWGVSFATNVHYMLMSKEGLRVVTAELGVYKTYVEDYINNTKNGIKEQEQADIALCEASVSRLMDDFVMECDASIRPGFGDRAIAKLKEIEKYFERTSGQYDDRYTYGGSIYDDDKDNGDKGKRGPREVNVLKDKYSLRIIEKLQRRESVIRNFYKQQQSQSRNMDLMAHFINDSLYTVDVPQITEIATPDVYYQFQKIQLQGNISNRLNNIDQVNISNLMKEGKTGNVDDIEKGEFRYRVYPSSRMFGTFNVWGDMLNGRLPADMKLIGWILFALIVDIVAFILRILAK